MSTELSKRIEDHPELKKCVETMLDIAEDVTGTLKKADDAEIQVVENMRKMGAVVLHDWATQQEKSTTDQWKKEHPEAKCHGKKKFIGKPRLGDKK